MDNLGTWALLVAAVVIALAGTMQTAIIRRWKPGDPDQEIRGVSGLVFTCFVYLGFAALHGIVIYLLWPLVAPIFSLRSITLGEAIAMYWVVTTLVQGLFHQTVLVADGKVRTTPLQPGKRDALPGKRDDLLDAMQFQALGVSNRRVS